MANLTPTLTLTSTNATTDSLSISVTDSLTIAEPIVASARVSVLHTASTVIVADATSAGTVYTYLNNTDSTNFVSVKNDAGNLIGKLNPGEFCFLPVDTNGGGLEVQADTASCIVEYATFTKS
jgi:hypothetical protein